MAEKSKIDIQVGSITFAAEGDQKWLSEQLEKVLAVASSAGAIQAAAPKSSQASKPADGPDSSKFTASLASHLKDKKAEKIKYYDFLRLQIG